jgi:hypothetical protein
MKKKKNAAMKSGDDFIVWVGPDRDGRPAGFREGQVRSAEILVVGPADSHRHFLLYLGSLSESTQRNVESNTPKKTVNVSINSTCQLPTKLSN